MIIGIICWILSLVGIYGFYNGLVYLTIIGMVATIIENIIGYFTGENRSFNLIWLPIIIGVILSFYGNNLLTSIAVCFCFENAIMFSLGLIVVLFLGKVDNK